MANSNANNTSRRCAHNPRRSLKTIINCLDSNEVLRINKSRRHSKKWLSNIIQIRTLTPLKLPRRSSKRLQMLMKHSVTQIKEKYITPRVRKVSNRMNKAVEVKEDIIWMICSANSLVEAEVVVINTFTFNMVMVEDTMALNSRSNLLNSSLRTQM